MIAGSFTALTNFRIGTLKMQRHRQQDDQDEDGEREVERRDQPGEVDEHAQTAVADRVGDRRADADRRIVHDDVREP